jgi:hypothetical protein
VSKLINTFLQVCMFNCNALLASIVVLYKSFRFMSSWRSYEGTWRGDKSPSRWDFPHYSGPIETRKSLEWFVPMGFSSWAMVILLRFHHRTRYVRTNWVSEFRFENWPISGSYGSYNAPKVAVKTILRVRVGEWVMVRVRVVRERVGESEGGWGCEWIGA